MHSNYDKILEDIRARSCIPVYTHKIIGCSFLHLKHLDDCTIAFAANT